MAYEALARKWRPKTFDEIVGQGHVTRALANAITSGKIHHAYLFSGTRGVGKTTFARILARALNCEKGPTPTPCLTCPSCAEVGSGTDVQEIDGASNTGIDDIRSLRENAAYAPSRLRYKVYIIDEVHMLSKQAFNGLLKTLEEPPPHVVFILATTEPNRIPDTILSRVQRFDFRMLTDAEVRGRLSEMARAEGISAEEDALALMARYAFGSMRDGQSLFEQAAVSGGGSVTAALVEGMLGLVGVEAAIDLASAAILDGAGPALTRFASLLSRGADLKSLFLSLIDVLRDAAVLSFTGQEALLFRHSPASLDRMRDLTARRSREEWMLLLDIAFRSERDVLATEFPHLGFELLLLRLANAQGLLSVEALEAGDAPAARPASLPADRPAAADVLPQAGPPCRRPGFRHRAPRSSYGGGTPAARSSYCPLAYSHRGYPTGAKLEVGWGCPGSRGNGRGRRRERRVGEGGRRALGRRAAEPRGEEKDRPARPPLPDAGGASGGRIRRHLRPRDDARPVEGEGQVGAAPRRPRGSGRARRAGPIVGFHGKKKPGA